MGCKNIITIAIIEVFSREQVSSSEVQSFLLTAFLLAATSGDSNCSYCRSIGTEGHKIGAE